MPKQKHTDMHCYNSTLSITNVISSKEPAQHLASLHVPT